MPENITIRGRIATTSLARGAVATVERTATIDRLIAGGFVEVVFAEGGIVSAEPEQVTAEGGTPEPRGGDDQSDDTEGVDQIDNPGEGEPEQEAVARRKPSRRKASS